MAIIDHLSAFDEFPDVHPFEWSRALGLVAGVLPCFEPEHIEVGEEQYLVKWGFNHVIFIHRTDAECWSLIWRYRNDRHWIGTVARTHDGWALNFPNCHTAWMPPIDEKAAIHGIVGGAAMRAMVPSK